MTLGQKVDLVESFILLRHKGQEGAALLRFAMMARTSGILEAMRATVLLTARLGVEKRLVSTGTAEVALKIVEVHIESDWAASYTPPGRAEATV